MTVVTCAPNVPDGVPYEGYQNRIRPQRETIDGVEVIRVWTYLAANAGGAKRILNYVSYLFSAVLASVFCCRRPDIVIATSPQFFCGWAGVLAQWALGWRPLPKGVQGRGGDEINGSAALSRLEKRRREWRVPLVLEIRDIWPESIVTVGAMRRGLAVRILERMERWMYLGADHIVAVGEGYKRKVLDRADVADRISVITNGVDLERFAPQEPSTDFLHRHGLEDRFVCSYVGTIGMAHGLETVLNAAEHLRSSGRTDIVFCLVGDGAERGPLQATCEARGLESLVKFTGRLPKSEMSAVLASSDALLVHLKKSDLFETVIPSKIFEAMAMNRPIVMGVRGEAADIVRRSRSGLIIEPSDPKKMVQAVCQLADDPELYRQLSESGRSFVAQQYTREVFAERYLRLLTAVAEGRPVAGGDDQPVEGATRSAEATVGEPPR